MHRSRTLVTSLSLGIALALTAPLIRAQSPESPAPRTFQITEGSTLSWVGRKVTGQHLGGFERFGGTVTLTGDDPATMAVRIEIDTASIFTDNPRLTEHLRSADFFEVETYPRAVFESISVHPYDGHWMVVGDLVLHGVTTRVSFPVEIEIAEDRLHATSAFALQRFLWGISYPGREGDAIQPVATVMFDVTAVAE